MIFALLLVTKVTVSTLAYYSDKDSCIKAVMVLHTTHGKDGKETHASGAVAYGPPTTFVLGPTAPDIGNDFLLGDASCVPIATEGLVAAPNGVVP